MAKSRRRRRGEDDPQTGRVVVLVLLIAGTFILFCVVVWLAVRKRHEGEKKAAAPQPMHILAAGRPMRLPP